MNGVKLTKEQRETLEKNLIGWKDMAKTGRPFLQPDKPIGDDCEDSYHFVCGPYFLKERKLYAKEMINRINKILAEDNNKNHKH